MKREVLVTEFFCDYCEKILKEKYIGNFSSDYMFCGSNCMDQFINKVFDLTDSCKTCLYYKEGEEDCDKSRVQSIFSKKECKGYVRK